MEPSEKCRECFPGECPKSSGIELVDQYGQEHEWNGDYKQATKERRTTPADPFHDVKRDE